MLGRALALLLAGTIWPSSGYAASSRLQTEVYVADEAAYGVTSTLIYGPTEALLVDAQYRNSDAERLADLIRAKGRRLTAIFITHPDLDHYLGLDVLHRRFPEAPIYMTAEALAEFKRSWPDSLASRRRSAPAETPETLPTPRALPKPVLSVDGRRVEILRNLQGDYASPPLNSPVWMPSEQVLVADDLVFNGIHAWLEDSSEAGRAEWRTAIARLEGLRPRIVIAGHKRSADLPDTPAMLAATSAYLADFDALRRDCPDVRTFIAAMTNKYPELGQPKFLALAAAGAYRK
jgi:glyoxylase-like metal-dependent hydrolase (beta-lactamase superfamily II)